MDQIKTLYKTVLISIANNLTKVKIDLNTLPASVSFDVCETLYENNNLCTLRFHIGSLPVFLKLLKLTSSRCRLHTIAQALEEHGAKVSRMLTSEFMTLTKKVFKSDDEKLDVIDMGIKLGTFLNDAAWFELSERVLKACQTICETIPSDSLQKRLLLNICHYLLRVQAAFCNLEGAAVTYEKIQKIVAELQAIEFLPNLSAVFTNISYYFFVRNDYHTSHHFSMCALKELNESLPPKSVIDTLRQASKSCVVKREFDRAGVLIRQAVDLAAAVFGESHPKYADAQLDYGFFLLNFDSIQDCVYAYEINHRIKTKTFLLYNIHVAAALEDLAYSLYVYEYSSGSFDRAKQCSESAITILQKLLPKDHMMLSSAQRVKALILEEIAIDSADQDSPIYKNLLSEAEKLHLCALKLGTKHYGLKNVQTAKHYGNLGRLYQSMRVFEQAEKMHKQAIEIKEEILGPNDYEVGLSLGHLASLYNYHMQRYDSAIALYLRSIQISLRLFGPGYSGLEYDYRGLIHVYGELHDEENVSKYQAALNDWRQHRNNERRTRKMVTVRRSPRPMAQVLDDVFNRTSETKSV